MQILDVIFRSLIIYVFIIGAIRFFGKREISQLSIVDLVFILLISNSVQNAMVGPNTSLWSGVAAAGTLFILNRTLGYLSFKSKKVNDFLGGSPIMLIYHGKVFKQHLDKAEISEAELEQAIREHGVEDFKDVDLAVLEADGNISILSKNFSHHTSKKRKTHKEILRDS